LNIPPVPLRTQAEVRGNKDVPPARLTAQAEGQEQTRKIEEDDGEGHPEFPLAQDELLVPALHQVPPAEETLPPPVAPPSDDVHGAGR